MCGLTQKLGREPREPSVFGARCGAASTSATPAPERGFGGLSCLHGSDGRCLTGVSQGACSVPRGAAPGREMCKFVCKMHDEGLHWSLLHSIFE